VNVLVLAEDFVKDEHVLQPIIKAMMKAVGKPQANVAVCRDPRFHGTGEALKWTWIKQALDRHRKVDIFLLCVDRDGNKDRRVALDDLEKKAMNELGANVAFLAENAWQEVEVWLLAGHDLPAKWTWSKIREERDPKERYYLPFAKQRGVLHHPAQGRGTLAREAPSRYGRIRQLCKEDVKNLERRTAALLGAL
jgi:hypothetical protein